MRSPLPTLSSLYQWALELMRLPLLQGQLLEDIELTAGTTVAVPHRLGRKLRGWLVVRTNMAAVLGRLYDEQVGKLDTDKFLHLRAEGYSPTLSLWVF